MTQVLIPKALDQYAEKYTTPESKVLARAEPGNKYKGAAALDAIGAPARGSTTDDQPHATAPKYTRNRHLYRLFGHLYGAGAPRRGSFTHN